LRIIRADVRCLVKLLLQLKMSIFRLLNPTHIVSISVKISFYQ